MQKSDLKSLSASERRDVFKSICSLCNEESSYTYKDLGGKLGIDPRTVKKFLKIAIRLENEEITWEQATGEMKPEEGRANAIHEFYMHTNARNKKEAKTLDAHLQNFYIQENTSFTENIDKSFRTKSYLPFISDFLLGHRDIVEKICDGIYVDSPIFRGSLIKNNAEVFDLIFKLYKDQKPRNVKKIVEISFSLVLGDKGIRLAHDLNDNTLRVYLKKYRDKA